MTAVTCPSGHPSVSTDYCDVCGLPIAAAATPATPGVPSPAVAAPDPAPNPVPAGGPGTDAGAAPATQQCPNCSEPAPFDALFCENCGYDFTTGTMPRPAPVDPLDHLIPPPAPPLASGSSLDGGAVPPSSPGASLDSGTLPPSSPGASPGGLTSPPGAPGASLESGTLPPGAPAAPRTAVEWVVERWVDPDWYALQQSDDPCPSPGLPVVVPLTQRSVLVGRPSRSRGITPEIDCGDDTGVSRRQAQLTTDGHRWWVEDLQSSNGTFVAPSAGPLPDDPIPPGQRRELSPDDRIYVGAWTRLVVRPATPEERTGLT